MPISQTAVDDTVAKVRNGLGYARLEDIGLISISGPDAREYLQSQTSNDVNALQPGDGQASALLDRKAHIQSYFSLLQLPEAYWLLLDQILAPQTLAHLEKYHFSEKLDMADKTDAFAIFTVQGPESWRFVTAHLPELGTHPAEYAHWEIPNCFGSPVRVLKKTFTGEEGYCFIVPAARSEDFGDAFFQAAQTFGGVPLDCASLEILRIEAGIPQYGVDMDQDVILPQTGLERSSVSYTKGCYQGQEVVAKVKTYGSVGKALVGLIFSPDAPLPPLDAPCEVEGETVGTFKSSVFSPTLNAPIAMVYLAREKRVPQKVLNITLGNTSYPATVVFLPFYTPLHTSEKARMQYDAGLKAFAEDKEEEAITLLRTAIELDPHLGDAYESLGVILSRRKQYDEAINLMHRLAEIEPDQVMPHTNLSVFYMQKGMKDEAEVEKAKATTLEFQNAMKAKMSEKSEAEALKQRQQMLEDKVQMYHEVLQLDAEDALANYGLGNTLNELQRFEEAIPRLEKALAEDPKYTVAYLALGKALENTQQTEAAKAIYTKGIDVAAIRGDLMPMQEMQRRLNGL